MLVKTYYSTGHFDVFDTGTLVDGSIFKGNALTNYALEISDAREGEALWLDCYYYESDKAYQNDLNPHGLPVARRRMRTPAGGSGTRGRPTNMSPWPSAEPRCAKTAGT